jgi:hypothetical protein
MNRTNQRRKPLSQPNKPWYATNDSIDVFALIMDKLTSIGNMDEEFAVDVATEIWDIARQYKNLTGEDKTGINQIVYSKKSNSVFVGPQLNDKMKLTKENFTRINNDANGNPRYVTSFLNLLSDYEKYSLGLSIDGKYNLALRKAKPLGGKKFSNKQYGGGIVFGSVFNLDDLVAKVQQISNS